MRVMTPTTTHPDPTWLARRTREVFSSMETFALSQAQTPLQRHLLETALAGFRARAAERDLMLCIHLPLLVYGGIRGDDEPAIPLAVATGLQYLGVDIIDDLTDGDRPAHWQGFRASEITVTGATLLCALPQLVLADLPAAPARLLMLQRTMARGLRTMAAGQQADLAMVGSDEVTAAEVEASVVAKSGGELAMWAALAAQLAEAPEETLDAYAQMGQAIGTAGEIGSSCYDLFQQAHSRDLSGGIRTLPIAYHLERLVGQERAAFLEVLDQARGDAQAQDAVRTRLRAAGVVRRCAVAAEIYRQKALRALARADPAEPARSGLLAVIDRVRFT
jgi:geranylgeranyl pyrophosphate synthase